MLIQSKSKVSVERAKEWAKSKGATNNFINLSEVYFKVCNKYGINFSIAYCQFAKETGFGKYGGVVNVDFHNPCGLKVTTGGGDKDPNAHAKFKNWEDGVSAHIEHLALYAGVNGFPLKNPKDPRHFKYLFGKAKTLESLTGNWCNGKNYSLDILKLINSLESEENKTILENDKIKKENKSLKEEIKRLNIIIDKIKKIINI